MKRISAVIFGMVTTMLFSAIAISAAENCPVSFGEYNNLVQSNIKNECLIVAKNCATETDTVQQRVYDLRQEIAKGSYVYSPAELRALGEQLQWIETESGNRFI